MPKNLTDGTSYAATVQFPVDSDSAGLQYLETGIQALADRTNYLKKYNEDVTSYTWVKNPIDCAIVNGWTIGTYPSLFHGKLVSAGASNVALLDLAIPGGVTLTKVYVLVKPAGASTMSFQLAHRTPTFSPAADPDWTVFDSNVSSGTLLQAVDVMTSSTRTIDPGTLVTLRITSGQASDEVLGIQVVATLTGEGRI